MDTFKKLFFPIIALIVFVPNVFAATFTTVAGGVWNDGATWGNTSPGTVGIDYPGVGDDAIITGGVTITVSGGMNCRNLLIDANSNNTINISSFFTNLTINGTLLGSDAVGNPTPPGTTSTINGGSLIFTGLDINGYTAFLSTEVIAAWNNINQINANVTFNLTTGIGSIDLITYDGIKP